MKAMLLSIALFAALTQAAFAKPGVIVQGKNGTKWCCPSGEKGDRCEKGASSTPVGARCNFASALAPQPNDAIVRK